MKRILLSALAGLALATSGCRTHEPDTVYVSKEAYPVYRLSPKLVGTWAGKLTEYDNNGAPTGTYDCTLEIRDTGTLILRGYGTKPEITGDFGVIRSDRLNVNFDVLNEGYLITLGSNNDILIRRSVDKVGDFIVTMHRKN